jgi:hypothetical protein
MNLKEGCVVMRILGENSSSPLLGRWPCHFIEPRTQFKMHGSRVAYIVHYGVTYIARLISNLHSKA